MKRRLSLAFWINCLFASYSAFLAVFTLVSPDWIEVVFGVNLDRHSGSFEWTIVVVCCLVTVLFSVLARRQWRRAPLKAAPAGVTET